MNALTLFIALLGPAGQPVETLPVTYKTHAACIAAEVATYAAPMGRYRLVSARCKP